MNCRRASFTWCRPSPDRRPCPLPRPAILVHTLCAYVRTCRMRGCCSCRGLSRSSIPCTRRCRVRHLHEPGRVSLLPVASPRRGYVPDGTGPGGVTSSDVCLVFGHANVSSTLIKVLHPCRQPPAAIILAPPREPLSVTPSPCRTVERTSPLSPATSITGVRPRPRVAAVLPPPSPRQHPMPGTGEPPCHLPCSMGPALPHDWPAADLLLRRFAWLNVSRFLNALHGPQWGLLRPMPER